jgi:hypothetical protein
MKRNHVTVLMMIAVLAITFAFRSDVSLFDQDPWTNEQLMEPADLAKLINDSSPSKPIIYDIGPGGNIRGGIAIGPTKEKDNLKKLREELGKLDKDTAIVIYCGCCPFVHCPNIRPAFDLLNDMKFTNHKLLNLPKNLKVDWIDKGYPTE